jgi:predicted component of type VI protein secretion system
LLLSGITLILVLTIAGRKTAHVIKQKRKLNRANDPLLQVVPIRQDRPAKARPMTQTVQSPTWPRALDLHNAAARLVRISENGHPIPSSSISLSRKEITFGSDPQQAITVLESPSVDPLHARLYHSPDKSYILVDAGSIAGTWVNYAPVSSTGMRLEHGDLVHIGRIAFRFELSQPDDSRQPIVVPYQEE